MRKEIINIEAKVDDAVKSVDKLNESVEDLGRSIKDNNEEVKDSAKEIEKASKSSAKGVKSLANGFKGLGTAIKAVGIGLIISALSTLKEVFEGNQKVADAFSVAFETVSLVFNQLVTAVVNVYESVAKSSEKFDALGKVMGGLITLVLTPFKLGFYEIKYAIQGAQLLWEQSFFGGKDPEKIKKLQKELSETANEIKQIGVDAYEAGKDIVTNVGEAVGEFGNIVTKVVEETSKISAKGAYESAKTNVQLKKSAEVAILMQQRLIEKNDVLAEKQRQIRDEERNSIEDRKKANDDLLAILDAQEVEMKKQADTQIASAQAEYDKNQSQENYLALLEAQNNKLGVLAQIEGFRSEQKMNDLALDREANDLTNSKLESESNLSIERKRFNAEQIEDDLARLEALKVIDDEEKVIQEARLQAIVDNANAGTQAKVDAQNALDEFLEQSRQTNITRDKEIAEEEHQLDMDKIQSKLMVLDAVIGLSDQESTIGKTLLILKQLMLAEQLRMDIKETISSAKKAVTKASLDSAETGTSVAKGTAKAVSTLNPVVIAGWAVTAIGVVSSMVSAFKKSKEVASSVGGVGGASAPAISKPQMPSFNIVGATVDNQLETAVGNQTQEPVKAYVVSSDVTTSQEMDRNIIEGASF